MKFLPRLVGITALCITIQSASATVFLFDPNPIKTYANLTFNDTLSGGYTESASASVVAPNAGIWRTMNYPGYMNYSSTTPHVDSASLSLDITQAGGVPWFAGTASLSQAANVAADVATLNVTFASYFEGTMSGTSLIAAMPLMAYNVSGVVSSHGGDYVNFNAQTDFYDNATNFIASIGWFYSNNTPGSFSTTVLPTLLVGSLFLTDNLITAQGFITLQADPSTISITPAPVPEPASAALLLLGAAVLLRRRK